MKSSFVLLVMAVGTVDAAESPFGKPPALDGKSTVAFTLSRPGDVEIALLDANGKVVRHLAAGVLGGPNRPPQPLKPGLEQRIEWDGKDDSGQPAKGGPFQFRVRTGTSVRFGKMIGSSAYTGNVAHAPFRAPLNGIVQGPQGNLFLLMMSDIGSHGNSGMWPWQLREFTPEGEYQKTWLPYAPSTPEENASGFRLLPDPGRFSPALSTSLYPVFAVLGSEIVPRLHKERIVFVHSTARQMHFLSLDGSNRLESIEMWPASAKLNCPSWLDIQVAFSTDGKYAYYSNVAGTAYDGKQPDQIDANWPQGRVYRHDLTRAGAIPEHFFDLTLPDWQTTKYWQPSAWDKKSAAAGIDTDAKGNLFICDLVNHRVVEVSPEGKELSATSVPWPDRVMVSRKSGDLYVISRKVSRGAVAPATLRRITGRGATSKVAAELELPGTIGGTFALDETGKAPVLWLAGGVAEKRPDGEAGHTVGKLLRIDVGADAFTITSDRFLNRDPAAISFVGYMDVDREADLVYVTNSSSRVWRFQGQTGEGGPLPIKAVDVAIGPKGDIYAWGTGRYEGPIARYARDLSPKPLAALGSHLFGYLSGRAGRGNSVCGLDVDSRGRVYATFGSNNCHVRVYDEKGELVEFPRTQRDFLERNQKEIPAAITGAIGYGGSLRVDAAGNIYLLQQGLPKDYPTLPGLDREAGYLQSQGSIYKFPPAGGEIKAQNHAVKEVVGSVATYAGCGPISRWNAAGACACTKPRFDVDDYGRLYIPNALTFTVSVRDNADNEIVRFGDYGNFDCQGPASKEPKPAIPLGWPVTAGAGENSIYVGDALNHRIVRVDRVYAAETLVPVAK